MTVKQEIFLNHIFLGKSATAAAKIAGYSPKTAYSIGQRLLKNVEIQRRLAVLQSAVTNAVIAAPSRRLEILTKIAEHKIETPVSAGHITQAVSEMNKMEHIYEPGGNIRDVNVVFVIGRGYANQPQLKEGKDDSQGGVK